MKVLLCHCRGDVMMKSSGSRSSENGTAIAIGTAVDRPAPMLTSVGSGAGGVTSVGSGPTTSTKGNGVVNCRSSCDTMLQCCILLVMV